MQDYIAQMMFNSPPGLSDAMDLAKMLACLVLIEPLTSPGMDAHLSPELHAPRGARHDFRIIRRDSASASSVAARSRGGTRGHLAASTYLQMALRPHIVHVVGHTEAHHAATAKDVIAACKVARRAIDNALAGTPT